MDPVLNDVFVSLGLANYIETFISKGATTPLLFSEYVTNEYLEKLTAANPHWPEIHCKAIRGLLPKKVNDLKRQRHLSQPEDIRPLKKVSSGSSDIRAPISKERHDILIKAFINASTSWEEHGTSLMA